MIDILFKPAAAQWKFSLPDEWFLCFGHTICSHNKSHSRSVQDSLLDKSSQFQRGEAPIMQNKEETCSFMEVYRVFCAMLGSLSSDQFAVSGIVSCVEIRGWRIVKLVTKVEIRSRESST